jgi:uncharacterized protein (DUF39 family)
MLQKENNNKKNISLTILSFRIQSTDFEIVSHITYVESRSLQLKINDEKEPK